MSKKLNLEHAATVEAIACETADTLLLDAIDSIGAIIPSHIDSPSTAILLVGHALLAKLDSIETSLIEGMENMRESLDFLAARSDDKAMPVPTAGESERMLGILKADWLRQHPEYTDDEYIEAMYRFEILAGL